MKVLLTGLIICFVWECYSQIDIPLEKQKFKNILKYEKNLGTKALFHDEKREIGSLKLVDLSEYQSEKYVDVLPSGISRDLREVRLKRNDETFKPSTFIYYYFSPKDSVVRKAEFHWNVAYNQTDKFNDNWFDDYIVALGEQKDRFNDYNNQFNKILHFLGNKLGAPKYLDKERVLKKDRTIEFWERKAVWDTPKIRIEQKLGFSKKPDENGFGIYEIKLTIDYK